VNAFALDSDGVDRHMGVNVFGHALLINRLLPLVRKTAALPGADAPRIIMLSSSLHATAPSSVKFASTSEVYTNEHNYGPNELYARSKLGVLLFVKYGLAERVFVPNGDKIWAGASHPGAVATDQQASLLSLSTGDHI
jgi:NAD(P)-dependent dehydrogenase (short-subunit alcohol dehydrogenase family)